VICKETLSNKRKKRNFNIIVVRQNISIKKIREIIKKKFYMPISYHEQFRENQRNKKQNGLFSKSKATAGGKLPPQRLTAVVKQPLRSDTFTLPTKRDETNFKVPKVNQTQNGSRRQVTNKPAVINPTPPAEQKLTEPMRKSVGTRSTLRQSNPTNLQRKPVRFTNNYNNTYYSSSPAYNQKTAPLADPLPQDTLEKSRRMRINNDDYIIHRRKDPPAYAYNDYQVSDIPTTSYATSLPPISQSANQTAPTVIIHPKETTRSDPPTVIIHSKENFSSELPAVIPTLSTIPSYPSSAPFMFLPSSATHTYPPTSTMILPNSTVPSYPQTSTMILPTTTVPNQPPVQTFLLPHPPTSTYFSQPLFYHIPFSNPKPVLPLSAPPPAPPPPAQPTIINQSSSSSSSAPAIVKTENKTEENNATIVVHPNTIHSDKKNVTIQLKMLDEVCFFYLFSLTLVKL
jgi:hypothetical protein